ncbi:MAG: aspartate aminotransferase family protein [Blastocatellia bacterium]
MIDRYAQSRTLTAQSARTIAGGVVSLNRKTDPPIVFVRGAGSKIYDADGHEYIDYHAAFAPHILGHNHPEVNEAVVQALQQGWTLSGSGTTFWEMRFAELLRAAVPSLERIQLTNSGSEATAHAIRLSRAWTGRDDIIVTLGGYNGWHNDVARAVMPPLEAIGPRVEQGEYRFVPMSAGIPDEVKQRVHVVNFNDVESVESVMRKYPTACVITEPALQNIGVVPPLPGYLASLRELCDRYGALLVFDEVKTGFRAALGGYQAIANVTPDLSTFGKAVANGYPLGVIGGRKDVMDLFDDPDPARRVLIAGTYNGHPLTVAAAIATLEILRRDDGAVFRQLEARSVWLQSGLADIFGEFGVTARISRIGSAFCVYFSDHIPTDWHDLMTSHDFDFDRRYRRALIDCGIYHFPLPCKQGSISAAHTEDDIAHTLEITRAVLREL